METTWGAQDTGRPLGKAKLCKQLATELMAWEPGSCLTPLSCQGATLPPAPPKHKLHLLPRHPGGRAGGRRHPGISKSSTEAEAWTACKSWTRGESGTSPSPVGTVAIIERLSSTHLLLIRKDEQKKRICLNFPKQLNFRDQAWSTWVRKQMFSKLWTYIKLGRRKS